MRTALAVLLLSAAVFAADYGKVTTQPVAAGVYLFRTSPHGDVGMSGNAVALVGDDGVLVFDTTATPAAASAILAEIRKLTPLPVRYVVNSHWHWDHWGGNQVFAEAFPGVALITHTQTRELMLTVEPRWNERGLKQDLPRYLEDLARSLAEAKAKGAPAERIRAAEERLAADRDFLAQKSGERKTVPNVTFGETMTVWLGRREVRILHARAITPGDTYLFLPQEKILITGDIVIDPYPFAIGGSYPAEWAATLRQLAALKPALVIPGHGEAQAGSALLERNLAMFDEVMRRVREAKAAGQSAEQVAAALDGESSRLAAMVGVTDSETFKGYFLDVFVKRCYRELEGPLSDLPDGLPQ